jgi:hypothetical protein
MDNWLNAKNKPNQTQFKANSNPTPKTVINPYITVSYTRKPPSGGRKNKPNTQNDHKHLSYKGIHQKTRRWPKSNKPKQSRIRYYTAGSLIP